MSSDIVLKCGDSRKLLRTLPDRSVDLILTDPPYNLGKFSTGNIKLPWRREINNDVADWDRLDFCPEEWTDEFRRLLAKRGNIFVHHRPTQTKHHRMTPFKASFSSQKNRYLTAA